MEYNGYVIKEEECRGKSSRTVCDAAGLLLCRGLPSIEAAKAKIDKLVSGEDRGTRPKGMRGAR